MALIAQLVEHCTANEKVVGSNLVQSLNFFFSGHFSSRVMAAFASFIFFIILLLLDTYYLEIHILEPSITSTEHKGPNPNTTALMWL